MEALAFAEPNLDALLDVALALVLRDSVICRLIDDVRHCARRRRRLAPRARAARAPLRLRPLRGVCHVVPQPRAHRPRRCSTPRDVRPSADDRLHQRLGHRLQRGNLGCLLGIRGCVAAIVRRWRGRCADRMYVSTRRRRAARSPTPPPRRSSSSTPAGARGRAAVRPPRFHFTFPGSVQGFTPFTTRRARLDGVASRRRSSRARRSPHQLRAAGVPDLYPGQTVRAVVRALRRGCSSACSPATA